MDETYDNIDAHLPDPNAQSTNFQGGLRIKLENSNENNANIINKRKSVGDLVPGIKVRNKEDLIAEYSARDIVSDNETADPLIYTQQGGLFKYRRSFYRFCWQI